MSIVLQQQRTIIFIHSIVPFSYPEMKHIWQAFNSNSNVSTKTIFFSSNSSFRIAVYRFLTFFYFCLINWVRFLTGIFLLFYVVDSEASDALDKSWLSEGGKSLWFYVWYTFCALNLSSDYCRLALLHLVYTFRFWEATLLREGSRSYTTLLLDSKDLNRFFSGVWPTLIGISSQLESAFATLL